MPSPWDRDAPGVLVLPSGRLVRGRGLRVTEPTAPYPTFGLYLLAKPPVMTWESRWVRWPDFRLPTDHDDAIDGIIGAWERSTHDRVEVACAGGRGRTGTVLACMAILDGILPGDATDYVRERYSPHAVETPGQRRFVRRFRPHTDPLQK